MLGTEHADTQNKDWIFSVKKGVPRLRRLTIFEAETRVTTELRIVGNFFW